MPLSNASSAALRLPSHGSGSGWFATPFLHDSCIHYFTPVYPDAIQALGRLQHPGIAQVYEAGIAAGTPYFVMEHIRGAALLEYSAARNLDMRQRIALMARICDAVHHAHQRGVIHRDLKPGNILVDESGQPKILDFGVARLLDLDTRLTRASEIGKLLGTLSYMSPEQAVGDAAEIDARSDVYALGLVLYELLAGRPPYETGRGVAGAIRVIREQDPAPLGRVNRELKGDLEIIASKALEKGKDRRYASAADLSADLLRYLNDQPILARRPGAFYQIRKFARRHTAWAAALAAIFLVLLGGIGVSTVAAARARRAEQTARAVSDFLANDLLAQAAPSVQANPSTRPDPDLKIRTALDRAAARIPGKFDAQPETEAALRVSIGDAYREIGLYAQAAPHLERGLELRRRVFGDRNPDTWAAMKDLAVLHEKAGENAAAEVLLQDLLRLQRQALGSRDSVTLATMIELATAIDGRGDWADSAALLEEILAGQKQLLGENHADTLSVMNNLSTAYTNMGRYADAAELLNKAVETKRRVLGATHPSTLLSMNNLAVAYRNLGRYADAENLLKQTLEARRATEGAEHPDTLASMNSLALLYQAQRRYSEAEPVLSQALETSRRLRPNHPDTTRFMNNLAETYWRTGQPARAEVLFREALELRRRVMGPNHPTTAATLVSLGELELEQQRYAAAEPLLNEAGQIYEKSAPTDWRRYYSQAMLGESLRQRGRVSEAAPLLSSAYQALLTKKDAIPSERRKILDTVADWKSHLP